MGHERTGALPKTEPWRKVVQQIAAFNGNQEQVRQLANDTLDNVRDRFEAIQRDPNVQAAFKFLTEVGASASKSRPTSVELPENPTPFAIARALEHELRPNHGSAEYLALAQAAATDAIAHWHTENASQASLFGSEEENSAIWRRAGTAEGFCEIARLFFANFTERYLNYFLEREASAVCETVEQRQLLERQLHDQVDRVSRHAFETAKIAQSFAAGWYNRHAKNVSATADEVTGFLAIAFGKLREDLRREKSE
jgi:hypothetical protein